MKSSEFLIMSAIVALLFSIVIMMEASVTGFGFIIGVGLFIYFLLVIVVRMMWSFSGTMDDALSSITGGNRN